MATDCRVCAAVAQGGRIRITEESGALLIALLRTARRESLRARREALNGGADDQRDEADAALRTIREISEEIHRTQDEKGWSIDQLQRPHETGSGLRPAEGS